MKHCNACAIKEQRIHALEMENSHLHAELEALRKSSIRDPLTGLLTRGQADKSLLAYINGGSDDEETEVSRLFIDLDHFKSINDTFGHDVGDIVLKATAQEISRCVRSSYSDVVGRSRLESGEMLRDRRVDPGRHGGEEFIVYLPDVPLVKVRDIAEKIRKSVKRLMFRVQMELRVTCSIGGANILIRKADAEEALSIITRRADAAMYAAKARGRNRVVFFQDCLEKQKAA